MSSGIRVQPPAAPPVAGDRPLLAPSGLPLALALRAGRMATWAWDLKTNMVESDPHHRKLFDLDTTEPLVPIGAMHARILPEDLPHVRQREAEGLVSGHIECEFRVCHRNGDIRWLASSSDAIRDSNGSITNIVGVSCDITERKQLDQSLRDSEQRFRATFEHAGVGIAHVAPSGRLLRVNETFCQVVGYSREELFQLSFQQITHPDDLAADMAQARKLFANEINSYTMEKRYFRKDGSIVWVTLNASVVRDDSGAALYAIAAIRDISDRKQFEHALQESQRRLAVALDAAEMGTWVYNLADNICICSEPAQRLYGLANARFLHDEQGVRDVIHEDDISAMWAAVRRACEPEGDGRYHVEYRVRRPDLANRWRWLSAWGRVEFELVDGRRHPVRMVGASRDITDRKLAEDALRQAKEAAEEASRAKDHFLAVLSHELRTPLTPVLMVVSEHLHNPNLPAQLRNDLAVVQRNINLETRLIDDLLDITRIARGKLVVQAASADLREIIGHAANTCLAEARGKGLDLLLDLGDVPLPVMGDATRLQQVFWNLIKNAVKFSRSGSIRVGVRHDDVSAQVTVEDDGIGMSPAVLGRIFTAFEQGNAGMTRKFGGLGLGLAISKAIVELHNGTISAASAGEGKGASFTVTIPLTCMDETTDDTPAFAGDNSVPGRARILLVEDHEDSARMLARILRRRGHQVKLAGDVASALRSASAEAFDIVLSDIGLPDGTGLELMRQIRLQHPELRGIALSGHGMDSDLRMSRDAGFHAHLVKPVDPKRLEAEIARVLGQA